MTTESPRTGRRAFLASAALLLPATAWGAPKKEDKKEEDVTPLEDLMREHGLLNRVLLIYDEVGHRLAESKPFPADVVPHAARIIRTFVENYHERNEEEYVFPRLEKAGQLVELTKVLRAQHQAGRVVTDHIEKATGPALKTALAQFIRMYRPHEAREDTVLFPAFRALLSDHEYHELGEKLEATEHKLFGEDGFEKTLAEVAELEKTLGIYDLAQFTPPSK
jgi:hemerythrin-like domain-containing protein